MAATNKLNRWIESEFIVTNGIGGYSASSLSCANTRKYHGVLVAAKNPPTQRRVLVHKVEERIKFDDTYFDLSTNNYGGIIHPRGFELLQSFDRQPVPTWHYGNDDWTLRKTLLTIPGANAVILWYENVGTQEISLELHPLFTDRDYHAVLHQNAFDFYTEFSEKSLKTYPQYGSSPIYCGWSNGDFIEDRAWYRNFHYAREEYRGLDASEDSYRIGYSSSRLRAGQSMYIIFSDDHKHLKAKPKSVFNKYQRKYDQVRNEQNGHQFLTDLVLSGDQLVVDRASTGSKTIIAGYHWFTDWGRDTMIAMRGLTISAGRKKETESILNTFFKYLSEGMLPNRFPDYEGQQVEYNTIDATLWLFIAMYEYEKKFGDLKFVRKHLPKLEEILRFHLDGTRYNIKVNDLGFLSGGEKGWQLTWMDARIGDYVVTPRMGAAVEINALWYNALRIYQYFEDKVSYSGSLDLRAQVDLFESNFAKYFFNDSQYLNDYIDLEGSPSRDMRCNQIYAVSLPFSPLNKPQQRKVFAAVKKELFTNYGLRTLSPDHLKFVPHYGGNAWERDTAYHQGTVWPFLIAEYFEADLKLNKYSGAAKRRVLKGLSHLQEHFYHSDCVHGISEIFDGLDQARGRGCVHQAWSIAGILKLYYDHELLKSS